MARRVRVASRAIRRGRRLKARPSDAPPATMTSWEDGDGHPLDVAAIRADEDEAPDSDEIESGPVRRWSRPAAPALDFDESDEPSSPMSEESWIDEDPVVRKSKYSRPPAPMLDFSAPAAAEQPAPESAGDEDDEIDPNATTLVSQMGPRASRPPPSRVSVVEADDEPSSDETARWAAEPGFVPEAEEPPISTPLAEPELAVESEDVVQIPSSLGGGFFRQHDASLVPVVDDLPEERQEEDLAEGLLTHKEEQRRRRLRRGVGAGVVAIGVLTLGLVAKATMSEQPAHAERHQATAAAVIASDVPATVEAKALQLNEPVIDEESDSETIDEDDSVAAEVPSGDYHQVTDATLKHLNEGEFEKSIPWSMKLIEMRPQRAFGYRCLGSALQDLGRYSEAQQVYSQCVTGATKGEVGECGALGGARLKR